VRNDPLIPVPKIPPVYEPLPSQTQRASELPIESMPLEQLAELIAWALKQETEEDFQKALEKLDEFGRLPKSVTLYETVDPLGRYDSEKRTITIDRDKVGRLVVDMKSKGQDISGGNLEEVVKIHEGKHALHHLAQDSSKHNRIWDEFSHTPSYLLEILAQLFTYHQVQINPTLKTTFLELEKRQPTAYGLWRYFKYVPEEGLYWMIRDDPLRIEKVLKRIGFDLPPEAISKQGIGKIAGEIYDDREGKIDGGTLPDIVSKRHPYPAVCYPGKPGNACFQTAFFFSLTARRYANPDKGHLNFRQMLGCLARHMKGKCGRTTKQVVILSDNWDADTYDEWNPIIDEFRDTAIFHVCLIAGGDHYWFRI
jgi:hypothetical protein